MIRFTGFAATALLTTSLLAQGQIYKVTDDDKGVVFTDRPETISDTAEQHVETIDLPELNTAEPVDVRPTPPANTSRASEEESIAPTVAISSPANETTIAMGPGNFSVSATVNPPLSRSEQLVLMIDGQAVGPAQSGASWFVQGALRGPHDLVVQRTSTNGRSIAVSEPVRVYVLRPSIIRR